jgi:hypothetical protein
MSNPETLFIMQENMDVVNNYLKAKHRIPRQGVVRPTAEQAFAVSG